MREANGACSRSTAASTAALAVVSALALAVPTAAARPVGSPGGGVTIDARTFGARDGLSHNVVFSLLQDRDGHLWIGTIDGLNRFDGRSFRIYRHDSEDPSSLSNSTVRDLWEAADGQLWVRTAVGLDRLDPLSGAVRRYPVQAWHLAEGQAGQLLVATAEGLLRYLPDEDRFESAAREEGADAPGDGDVTWSLSFDSSGRAWMGTREGELIVVLPDGGVRRVASPWRQLVVAHEDAQGQLWIGHREGVGWYAPERDRFEPATATGAISGPVVAISQRADGSIWMGGAATYRLGAEPGSSAERVPVDGPVWALLEDREGALWIGSNAGLRYIDPYRKPFRVFAHDPEDHESLPSDAVSALAVDGEGALWVGTLDAGLGRLDPATGRVDRFPALAGDAPGPCGDRVWSIAIPRDGQVWVATETGLCVLEREAGRFRTIALGADPVPAVGPLLQTAAGEVWAGTSRGLFRIDGDYGVVASLLSGRGIQALARGRDGDLWVGTSDSEVYRVAPGSARAVRVAEAEPSALGSEGYWSLSERRGGDLWLAGDRGLVVLDPDTGAMKRHPATAQLPSAAVYAIVDGPDGATWLSTNHGLLRLRPEVSAPAAGALRRYGAADGLAGEEFNRRAAVELPDGRVAFGGMDGVTLFDPRRMRDNPYPPPVAIQGVERFRRDGSVRLTVRSGQTVRLPYDDTGVAVEFAALTFSSTERVAYAYRLEGIDEQWVRAGVEPRARYPALPPGRYRFAVRAANGDGVWNHDGAAVELLVQPPWWATSWFRAVAGLAALFALVAVVRQVSTRRLRRRLVELERERDLRLERERISRDLHDNVGSQMATILSGLELARLSARSGDEPRAEQLLESLGEDARRTMAELRDTVWSLHADRVPVSELVERTSELLGERGRYAEEVVLGVDGKDAPEVLLESAAALHLFRIAQEAVNNALRHGSPSAVVVCFGSAGHGEVRMTVRSNAPFRAPEPGHAGRGILNMRSRAEQAGGSFRIDGDARGTRVEVVLPAERATR